MSIHDDIKLIEAYLQGDLRASTIRSDPKEAWNRIKAAAVAQQPAFPSFMGFMIAIDPTLAEGVVEFRDNAGNVLGTFKATKP